MHQRDADFVAAEVRAEMGRQGKTNAWLAAELNVSEMWVGRRLRLARAVDISDDELERIAAVLGVPMTKFLPATASTS